MNESKRKADLFAAKCFECAKLKKQVADLQAKVKELESVIKAVRTTNNTGMMQEWERRCLKEEQEVARLNKYSLKLLDESIVAFNENNALNREVARLTAELNKWNAPHTDKDLQDMKEQSDGSKSLAAQQAYINALEFHLKHLTAELAAEREK